MYKVYLSNPDFECIERVFFNTSRDIAETKAVKLFLQNGCMQDFIVLDAGNEMVSNVLTDRTKRLRGECQG